MSRLTPPRVASALLVATMTIGAATTSLALRQPAYQTARPNGQGKVLVVGDSLTVGAYRSPKARFSRQLPWQHASGPTDPHPIWTDAVVDARVGRRIAAGATVIAQRIVADPSITAVVVALGTNDLVGRLPTARSKKVQTAKRLALLRTKIADVLAAAQGRPVLWINAEFGPRRKDWNSKAALFTRALHQMAQDPAYSGRLHVADWASAFPNTMKGRIRYAKDGIHLNAAGYRYRASWMTLAMKAFGGVIVSATTTTTTTTLAPPPPEPEPEPEPEPQPGPDDSLPAP